ncbi:MAG: transglycosylase SLT domain-containing protein [Vicinamibacterales bacterium]
MKVRDMRRTYGRIAATAMSVVVCLLAVAQTAHAEIVFFSNGRTMSVRSHRAEGDRLVLSLRSGGEMVVDAALVAEVGPDEVPYPEPAEIVAVPDVPASVGPTAVPVRPVVSPVFEPLIRRVAAEQGVDVSLVRAVIQVESAYQPRARSSKGAIGLMQVMPATGRQYGIRNLYDPASNIRAGVTHLRSLLERYPLALALAAYNAGAGAVDRFEGIPPFPETVDYVARVRALAGR